MRNLAKIVKDENNNIYLKVYDKKVKILAYFLIMPHGRKKIENPIDLSDVFSVDLSGEK